MKYKIVNNEDEIRHFIRDLREAFKKAKYSGGGHSAFLHDDTGSPILQIEVALPVGDLVK